MAMTLSGTSGITQPTAASPTFSAYLSTTQTLSANTWTKITCQTKEWDTGNAYDNATNYRFTPQIGGYYQVSCNVAVASATTPMWLAIYKNGAIYKYATQISSTSCGALSACWMVNLNGTSDYIELYAYISISQPLAVNSSAYTYFQSSMIRSS